MLGPWARLQARPQSPRPSGRRRLDCWARGLPEVSKPWKQLGPGLWELHLLDSSGLGSRLHLRGASWASHWFCLTQSLHRVGDVYEYQKAEATWPGFSGTGGQLASQTGPRVLSVWLSIGVQQVALIPERCCHLVGNAGPMEPTSSQCRPSSPPTSQYFQGLWGRHGSSASL